ncbi:MAG TPA: hypothetical protein VK386_08760 [Acidimicrobiales bacterium]|nr:hypothetical protein [Acidimicrobiales bacterium]
MLRREKSDSGGDPNAVQPAPGPPPVTAPGAPATTPVRPVAPALFDTRAAEEEIGRLVLRVRDITNSMLDEARRQAEGWLAQARAESARVLEAAQRQAGQLQSDNVLPQAVQKLQAALVALGEVNAALVRQLSAATAPTQGQPSVPTAQAVAQPAVPGAQAVAGFAPPPEAPGTAAVSPHRL